MSIWYGERRDGGDGREGAGGKAVLLIVVVLALLAGGGYYAAYANASDNVPRGTTVADVAIGGRTPAAAAAALADGLALRAAEPFTVTVGGRTEQVDPVEAGLGVDYDASVAEAGAGRSWDLARLWDYYTGGDDLAPVVTVDEAAMSATITRLGEELGATASDGGVAFRDGGVQVTPARRGQGLDAAATREALVTAYLTDVVPALELSQVDPEISDADVQDALDEIANPAMSGPVTLMFGRSPLTLLPRDFEDALSMRPAAGRLRLVVDQAVLAELVADAPSASDAPVDATVALVDGEPQVVPGQVGTTYEPAAVVTAFRKALTRPEGKRRGVVASTSAAPGFTTKDARALKVREQVSSFTTNYPYASYRNVNIGRAAELVDGTLLLPGEVFSLNDVVGERTRENGFTDGFVISNGIFTEDLGGGVSQMATTLFNAAFFAGLEDVEHKAHSLYIDRYPVGREATVAFGSVDLRFRNDTRYGVLISATVTPSTPSRQGVVNVRMFSTKVWDITAQATDRYAYTSPGRRVLTTDDCVPNTGYSGFQIDVTRVFRRAGETAIERTEDFHTTYQPSDTVVCR